MKIKGKQWCVYKLTSPSGKVYIGMTQDIRHRWRGNGNGYKGSTRIWSAIQEYGWDNFKREIVFEHLSESEACEKEIELIAQYKATDLEYGYNLESGGRVFAHNEETRKKLSQVNKGHLVNSEVRKALSQFHSQPVICLETQTVYPSALMAGKIIGISSTSINKCTRGTQDTANGCHFAKLSDYQNGTVPKYMHSNPYRMILCIETRKVYKNACEASRDTGVNRRGIAYACDGKYAQFKGFHWRYLNPEEIDDMNDIIKKIRESGD